MIQIENISTNARETGNSRRDFLKGMLGAGALVLGVSVMPEQLFAAAVSGSAGDPFPPTGRSAAASERLFGDRYGWNGVHRRAPLGDGKWRAHILAANRCR